MSENKALIAIVQDFSELDRILVESNGELTPELEQQMLINADNMRSKVDRYKLYMDHLDSRAMYFKDIENQAAQAKKMFQNHKDRLKENIKYAMKCMETDELQGVDWRFKMSKLKDKLVLDEKALPPEFRKLEIVQTLVPDKSAIESALMLGEIVPGASLEQVDQLRSYVNHSSRSKPVKETK